MTELRKRMLQDLPHQAGWLLRTYAIEPVPGLPKDASMCAARDYGFFSPRRRATRETVKALFGAAPAGEHRPAPLDNTKKTLSHGAGRLCGD